MQKISVQAHRTVSVQSQMRVTTRPGNHQRVNALPDESYWQRNGWRFSVSAGGEEYLGQYRVVDPETGQRHNFDGWISVNAGRTNARLRNPPASLLRHHPKSLCFHLIKEDWWRMNWYRGTQSVDETIIYVEQLLLEALTTYRRA